MRLILNMNFTRSRFTVPVLALLLASSTAPFLGSNAQAGEGLFSRAYTTETVPAGHYELEETVRNRTQRAFGTYDAFDFKSEFEYGVTDALQAALYVNAGYLHAKGAPDDNDPNGETGFTRNGFFLTSISGEIIYRVLSPVSDPIGLAFYLEPEVGFHDLHNGDQEFNSYAIEFRTLFQKNFLEDQLILVYNFVAEVEFFRYGNHDTPWFGELDWNNEIGGSYRVAANWYAGLEFRNHNEVGNFFSHDHSVFWIGPVIHYGGPKVWATLGLLREVAGNPDGNDAAGSYQGHNLFLHSHELWETTAKIGFPF